MKKMARLIRCASASAAAVSIALIVGMGDASAATKVGWVGPTPPGEGNQLYLTTSTISNAPLQASSRIYTAFGNSVPGGYMGVQARLFKSGVLCQITGWVYNPLSTNTLTTNTNGNCGSGSYNSHGFVQYWTGAEYGQFLTFPTDPLDFSAPALRSAGTVPQTEITTNSKGQSLGSAENARTEDEQPDLIAAYGTQGETGYLKKTDLITKAVSPAEAVAHSDSAPRTVPLYAADGTTTVGSFTIK
ncbi:hypothetical protein [Williamsia muralis]|uniref:hypothetical protein n=1 Tax=Williamsia marianensis TaxID=85044 RepID=UPI000DE7B09F|nr:hypothetical protein [Williamsia marianensis]PVY27803.1 hypothetical protein C7458_110192 [Williamsia marianensis]